jgi:hypothetical protein
MLLSRRVVSLAHQTAHLHWVRADDINVVLSGSAVQTGKRVRLRAEWQPSATYMGPEEFRIREEGSFLARIRDVLVDWGYEDGTLPGLPGYGGPPVTLSQDQWVATASRVTRQSRYRFTDVAGNRSGPLIVSSVTQYTRQPHLEASISAKAGLHIGQAGVTLTGSEGAIIHGIGATADPAVRIVIMTPWGDGEENLVAYVQQLMFDIISETPQEPSFRRRGPTFPAQSLRRAFGWSEIPGPWIPSLESRSPTVLEVDEDYEENVLIVPTSPVPPNRPFRTAYALRVVDIENSASYVISDVVEVQGDGQGQTTYHL